MSDKTTDNVETAAPTTDAATASPGAEAPAAPKKGGGLGGKVLAELQEIAAELKIDGAASLRKGELIDAIKAARGDAKPAAKAKKPADKKAAEQGPAADAPAETAAADEPAPTDQPADKQADQPAEGTKPQQAGGNGQQNQQGQQNNQNGGQNGGHNGDGDEGGARRRNRRGRNRTGNRSTDGEPVVSDDDVLVPAAGILDILDNYAFVRTTGYLPSESDVYVSLSMVKKWGLRKGDAIVGQVRQPREGERKEKFNPMVRVDTVNGMTIDDAKKRSEFDQLVPLHPSERLRLEGQSAGVTGRLIDLFAPIGKGQRGLIVSPPKAGKTTVLQQIATAVTENNPEVHLMVVLVDERPEEVTDFQRTVKGEVIASTFDRPASDHTTVAELAIERAKRLVELGHDVVVLLDGLTRLGRAYNLAAPASGRTVAGAVDAAALYPPKKFFGAARKIEDGGSLTIIATASVESGSRTDEAIFEEFEGTSNLELRLRRDLAEKRVFPAIDVAASRTRRDDLLVDPDELAIVAKVRQSVVDLDARAALESVLDRLGKTNSNTEFLLQSR